MRHGAESFNIRERDGSITKVSGEIMPRSFLAAFVGRFWGWLRAWRNPYRPNPMDDYKPDYKNPKKPPAKEKPPAKDKPCSDGTDPDQPSMAKRVFCRLFDLVGPDQDGLALADLGLAMAVETLADSGVAGDSNIPGGYTYLGQFIDHDITATPGDVELDLTGNVDPDTIPNERTPTLDLDCLYGLGPAQSSELFEADGAHLKVGNTAATSVGEPGGPIAGGGPHDLPRRVDKSAIIGDGRNDENLAVAQTHLAFIKFHNLQVDRLIANGSTNNLFERARQATIQHYQAIVLTDFLPRIADATVVDDVLQNGRQLYSDDLRNCMPVEFAVAAYRMGHSMVRADYEWNRIFNSRPQGIPATFELIFEFSGVSGTRVPGGTDQFFGKPRLPSNWPVDWTRLYDFSNVPGVDSHPDLNFARKLDANMALALNELPEFMQSSDVQALGEDERKVFVSLGARNLLRGRLVRLPTGQQVVQEMAQAGISVPELTAAQLNAGPHGTLLQAHGFDVNTPLWYYILREAMVMGGGNTLGPVGSRIVAEVLVGLVDHSNVNVRVDRPGFSFSMPELLAEVGDLNPLG